ncbi:protein kinase domain-containing protein [Phthorimaea operculella]|nr:protein kinase domain-containing protein [Phthorimaea operculella]
MTEDILPDSANTQTQTQNSQVEWSQNNTPAIIPTIWGRLYSTKVSMKGANCWKKTDQYNPEYYDLIQPEFTLGRALNCTFVMKKDVIKEDIIRNVSKQHFRMQRDLTEALSPAIITDLSYNVFVFKDLLKNEQDQVPAVISKKYYISRTLGQGACGIVKLVYDKTKCSKHAMKIIKKSKLTNGQANSLNNPEKIMNEINIMKALQHPCIISTEEVFDSREAVYIVLELMQGGELFDRITKHGRLTERLTRFLFRQMVLAVKYLHSQGITHRDLKPENVLLESKEEESLVKITDFGLSKFVGEHTFMKTMCGTPLYLAPEVLRANGQRCYGPEVDVWSLGVIFFICLVGYLPFSQDYKDLSLHEQILCGRYRFSAAHWRGVSLQAKLLMKRMLTVNVARRITLDQILDHAWMQDTEVIQRVELLLSASAHTFQVHKTFSQLTVSSTSDQENHATDNLTVDNLTVLRVVAKRALSDSFSSAEPVAKRIRIGSIPERENDTSSATRSGMDGNPEWGEGGGIKDGDPDSGHHEESNDTKHGYTGWSRVFEYPTNLDTRVSGIYAICESDICVLRIVLSANVNLKKSEI